MMQAEIRGIYDIAAFVLLTAEALVKSYCFYRFVKPFIISSDRINGPCPPKDIEASPHKREKSAVCGAAAYFLIIMLFYITGFTMDVYLIYGTASLIMLLVICLTDKRNYRQKSFLVITFSSLSWSAAAMAEILYDFLYDTAMKTDYMQNHPEMSCAVYIMMCVCYLTFDSGFTVIGIRRVLKVYTNKGAEMEKREVVMLALPSVMGLIGYEIMRYYRVFYVLETGKVEATYDSLTMLFCVVSSITISVVIMLYQTIKAKQEENRQSELLAVQIDSIRRHIQQTESLYQNILSIKHDMTNHILTLERLYEGNKTEEARAYGKDLKAELARMTGGTGSGNPVTDVILQEFKEEAEKRGITFHSEFYYPADSDINAFDISIILNNALQNAIENTTEDRQNKKQVSIISYRRNNAYILEIRNSFTGSLQWNTDNRLPATSKPKTDGHGYGLPNIRKVAEKYSGDIDITFEDGTFDLCVMLMLE